MEPRDLGCYELWGGHFATAPRRDSSADWNSAMAVVDMEPPYVGCYGFIAGAAFGSRVGDWRLRPHRLSAKA